MSHFNVLPQKFLFVLTLIINNYNCHSTVQPDLDFILKKECSCIQSNILCTVTLNPSSTRKKNVLFVSTAVKFCQSMQVSGNSICGTKGPKFF